MTDTPKKKKTRAETLYKPGHKAHPRAGRPKGAKNKKSIIEAAVQTALVNRLEKDAIEIYTKAAEMAKAGDPGMIKLFLSRLLPELKATGDDENKKAQGGVQIIVNSYQDKNEKDVTPPITVNQLPSPNEEDDNDE